MEFWERKSVEKGASLGGKPGRDDEFHFGYVESNIFM